MIIADVLSNEHWIIGENRCISWDIAVIEFVAGKEGYFEEIRCSIRIFS